MKAEIKKLHSPDIGDLQQYSPEILDEFGFLLQIMVGEKGENGYESFDVIVCTPKWILKEYTNNEPFFGLYYLIVFEYSYIKIYNKLKVFIESIDEPTWDLIASKISKIGRWEFEDYQSLE